MCSLKVREKLSLTKAAVDRNKLSERHSHSCEIINIDYYGVLIGR